MRGTAAHLPYALTEGTPDFSVAIALVLDGEPVVGVVYNPIVDALYAAARGAGCTRNGDWVSVSGCHRLEDARVYASRTELEKKHLEPVRDWFSSLEPKGSIAWKLALVAGGEIDFNVSMRPKNEWDVCAGDLLVREAGGGYQTFEGEPRRYNQPDPESRQPMIAGNRALLEAFRGRAAAIGDALQPAAR